VRKFAKPILITAGILLFVYVLAVLGLNIYLQSQGLQARICSAASVAVGKPVSIQGAHYTPWSGFTVNGIMVPQLQATGAPPEFEAESINFRFAFFQLLRGKLMVKEVLVNSPVLLSISVPRENLAGRVEAPPGAATPAAPTAPAAPSRGGVEITVPQPRQDHPPAAPLMEVRRVKIKNGRSQVFDSKGGCLFDLNGIEAAVDVMPDGKLAGKFLVGETSVGTSIHPRGISGTFSFLKGRLEIPDIRGTWADGQITGTFELDPALGFSTTASVDGVLVKKLADDAGISADGARGSLFARGSLRGLPGAPESYSGKVDANLQEARLQPLDFIRQIGDLMNIQELQMLELKTAEGRFVIRDQQVVVEKLILESANLFLEGTGPVGFDGKMKLRSRLHLNEKLRRDLGGLLSDNFEDSDRAGYRFVPFSVTGSVSRPKTDLLDKLTGFRIGQDIGGLLKNLFQIPVQEKGKPGQPGEAK